MKTFINTQVKNEALLLEKVLPFWKEYPVEKFVFYNDGSTDNTHEVIMDLLGSRAKVFNTENGPSNEPHMSASYNEALMRHTMMTYNREQKADMMIALDADELISYSILNNFDEVLEACTKNNLQFFWYNVVGETLKKTRQDPLYVGNYRCFIVSLNHCDDFDLNLSQQNNKSMHQTPRTPNIHLPKGHADLNFGFIHLQAINTRFFALKQLFYKVFERRVYGQPLGNLMNYDQVCNNFNFNPVDTPPPIINDWEFDASVFDKILEERKYEEYIKKYGTDETITFGKQFLS